MIDKNGREIRHGDLLRVLHYVGANRRNVYMYKLVVRGESGLNLVDVCGIAQHGVAAHRCSLGSVGSSECEIIDGLLEETKNAFECWYERPRKKGVAK